MSHRLRAFPMPRLEGYGTEHFGLGLLTSYCFLERVSWGRETGTDLSPYILCYWLYLKQGVCAILVAKPPLCHRAHKAQGCAVEPW